MVFLLFSCNQDLSVEGPTSSSEIEMGEIIPEMGPAEVFQTLESQLNIGLPNADELMSIFMMLMDEGGTEQCPGTGYNFNGSQIDSRGCTSALGTFFAGTAEFHAEIGGYAFHCDCRIESPDGIHIRGAGNILNIQENNHFHLQKTEGSFESTVGNAWLQHQPSAVFSIIDSDNLLLDGGYTVDGISVYYRNFLLDTCEGGQGSIEIRDPSGGWWKWVKDDCDEPGNLWFGLEDYGEWSWDTSLLSSAVEALLVEQ
jgi:hypothetical protein